jgi:3-hexulose-6-phosphate synthase
MPSMKPIVQISLDLTNIDEAIACPDYGAPLVVLGAPLTIDADAFQPADGDLEASLKLICDAVHAKNVADF